MGIPAGTTLLDSVLNNARSMLSRCTAFQKLVGAADATAALAYIYLYSAPTDEGEPIRPVAIINDIPGSDRFSSIAYDTFQLSGSIQICIEAWLQFDSQPDLVTDLSNLRIDALAGHGSNFFKGYQLQINGETAEIDTSDNSGNIVLIAPLDVLPTVADTLRVIPESEADHTRAFRKIIDDIATQLAADSYGGNESLNVAGVRSTEWGRCASEKEDYFGVSLVMEFGQ